MPRSKSSRGPNPYITLPAKTNDYIQIRFQLLNFKNVFRIVQLPTTFTFANLHTLIQYMFGWSDSHLHRAEVVSYVVMHDPNGEQVGMMKRWGRKPNFFQEYLGGKEESYGDRISWKFERDDNPLYNVEQCGQPSMNLGLDYAKTVKDSDLTLGDVWTKDFENNAARGECQNDELGIIYEYDLGDSWKVHISCDAKELFFETGTPFNLPLFIDAQGAPPIEHVHDENTWEDGPNDKTVSDRLLVSDNFVLYCEGKLMSCARRTELAIYTRDEENERQARLQRRREERMEVDDAEEDDEYYDASDDSGELY